jgi:glycosyltransferase involved in cell wall biosynthesis
MRILLTADPELPVPPNLYGGIERIIDFLARGLQARGHTVGLVAHRDSICTVNQHFAWPGLRSQSIGDTIANTSYLWQAVQKFRPDVLHSFSRLQYLLPLLPRHLPKIMSYQRQPTMRTVNWASKLGGRYLSFTGCSEHIAHQGRQAGGHWHSIHNGIELDRYAFQPQVKPDAPLVFLSRLERIKGVHHAIAVAQATGKRLLIAGNRVSSPEGEHYWQTAIAPHLDQNRIEYVGPVNDQQKNALLGQAAAMIVPIEWDEPFGIVFAEALACGTPVISSPRGALPEIVRSGIDGFLVRSVDEAIGAVQQLDRIDRQQCRDRAESHFADNVIVNKYDSLYQSYTLK